jgi:hypothetical protein
MLTINGQQFITLDTHIDIKKILDLKDDLNFLFSSRLEKARTGTFHTGGMDPNNIPNVFRENDSLYLTLKRANVERKTDKDLDNKLSHFEEKQDKAGLVRYLKLRYRAYDPYNVMQIRSTNLELYAADGLTFTDTEWDSYSWMDGVDPKIIEVIESLPFEKLGTITLFVNEHYTPLGYHRDFNFLPAEKGNMPNTFPHRQEMLWVRFDLDRPFYLIDINGDEVKQTAVEGYSAFYNHHNWHGNFTGIPFSSLTMKIEGAFTQEFRKKIGVDNLDFYYEEQQ